MRQPVLARRYAKALFGLALETGQLQKVREDIRTIRELDHPQLVQVLLSPIIREEKKVKIFNEVFKDEISPLTLSFFELVFRKGREIAFRGIADSFEEQYRDNEGIVILQITTSVPISDELKEDILRRFQSRPGFVGKRLVMEHKVDEKLIGGFVAQTGDWLYDASIRNDLRYIKKQFVENMYVMRIR